MPTVSLAAAQSDGACSQRMIEMAYRLKTTPGSTSTGGNVFSLSHAKHRTHSTVCDLPGFHRFSPVNVLTWKIRWAGIKADRGCWQVEYVEIQRYIPGLNVAQTGPGSSLTWLIVLFSGLFFQILMVNIGGWLNASISSKWQLTVNGLVNGRPL